MKLLFSIPLIFFYLPLYASANLNLSPSAYVSDNYFKLDLSKTDLDAGKNLISLFNDLNDGKTNKKIFSDVVKLKDKQHSFNILNPFFIRLEKAYQVKNFNDQKLYCTLSSETPNEFTSSLVQRFNLALDRYCRSIFLKRYSTAKKFAGFSEEEKNFFAKILPFYIEGEDPDSEVTALLKAVKKDKELFAEISDMIIDIAVKLEAAPTKPVLQHLKLNEKINTLVQKKNTKSKSNQSFFLDEFNKLHKEIVDTIKEDNFAKAKEMITAHMSFYSSNKAFIPQKRYWSSLSLIAKEFFYKGKDEDTEFYMSIARANAPETEFSESHFNLIWPHVVNRDFLKIKNVAYKNKMYENFDKLDSKVQYWIATALTKANEEIRGTTLLNKMISKSPFSFYSIVALKDIAKGNKNLSEEELLDRLISKDSNLKLNFSNLSLDAVATIKRMNVWYKLNFERFGALESRHLMSLTPETGLDNLDIKVSSQDFREYLTVNLIKYLNDQGKYISSFKIFQDNLQQNSLSMNMRLVRLMFPTDYFDIIKKNSKELDPLVVISLMRQESAFNKFAQSPVGARGLMQLMPATAKRFNKKVKINHLSDPEINIAIGTKYLKLLFDRFEGNIIYTLASYNAGEHRIDRWRKEIFRNSDPLATIESIPFEETRNYVKLIYRNNFFYSYLLDKTNIKTPLEETFKLSVNENKIEAL